MSSKQLEINLNVEIDNLTSTAAAHLVTEILKGLLYQRNQIPFVFPTFKFLISKWKQSDEINNNFSFERRRTLARSTCSDIDQLTATITQAFQGNRNILSVRILFGTTPQMPKEIYHIKLPQIWQNHSHGNCLQTFDPNIRQILRTILTTDHLYKTFSVPLTLTNIFLDIETNHQMPEKSISGPFIMKDLIEFSPTCKQIIFNITNNLLNTKNINCEQFQVFDENHMDIRNQLEKTSATDKKPVDDNTCWWDADCHIKGFKDIISKQSLNIWRADV